MVTTGEVEDWSAMASSIRLLPELPFGWEEEWKEALRRALLIDHRLEW